MPAPRLPFARLAPDVYKALRNVSDVLATGSLDPKLIELLYHRVSQINGCAFCLDMHGRALRAMGEDIQRMDGLAGWRDSTLFSDAERAALDWAEHLTRISEHIDSDVLFEALTRHYQDRQIAELTFAVATINAWNRIAISMRPAIERKH